MKHRVKQKMYHRLGFLINVNVGNVELMRANIVMLLHGWLDLSFLLRCCWKKLHLFGTFHVSPFHLSH